MELLLAEADAAIPRYTSRQTPDDILGLCGNPVNAQFDTVLMVFDKLCQSFDENRFREEAIYIFHSLNDLNKFQSCNGAYYSKDCLCRGEVTPNDNRYHTQLCYQCEHFHILIRKLKNTPEAQRGELFWVNFDLRIRPFLNRRLHGIPAKIFLAHRFTYRPADSSNNTICFDLILTTIYNSPAEHRVSNYMNYACILCIRRINTRLQ